MRRWVLAGAASLAAAGFLAGCGLESIPELLPPGNPPVLATSSTNIFQIVYTTDNNQPEFRGFELYYSFYPEDLSKIEGGLVTREDLLSHGFLPVLGGGELSSTHVPPLVPVDPDDRDTSFISNVDFTSAQFPTQSNPPFIQYNGPATGTSRIEIRRNGPLVPGTQQAKTFAPRDSTGAANYLSTDSDITFDISSATRILVVFYALSYGLFDVTSPLYSTAVYLGYTPIQLQ